MTPWLGSRPPRMGLEGQRTFDEGLLVGTGVAGAGVDGAAQDAAVLLLAEVLQFPVEELHFEDERGAGRDLGRAARVAVGVGRRAVQHGHLATLHRSHAQVPRLDHVP